MRSHQKRKVFEEQKAIISANKRSKMPNRELLPIPKHVECHPKKVEYYFYSVEERQLFQKEIEAKLKESIKSDALIIELDKNQFNRWTEINNGFNELMQIKEWVDNCSWNNLNARLSFYTPHFINQVVLLKSDTCLFETMISTMSQQFCAFYSKIIHLPLFNHLIKRNLANDWNVLMLAARHHPNEMPYLLQYINDETYQRIVFNKNLYSNTFFQILCHYGNESSIHLFLKKLQPESMIQLLLFDETPITFNELCSYPKELFYWINSLFNYPKVLKKICEKQSMLTYLRIFDGGDSIDQWSKIAKYVLDATPPVYKHSAKLQLSNYLSEMKIPEKYKVVSISDINKKNSFMRIQGRTLLFENESKKIVALKILKVNEKISELVKEFRTSGFLYHHAKEFDLKSQFPEPKNIILLTDLSKWVNANIKNKKMQKELFQMIGEKNRYAVYEYHVDNNKNNYFTYLHDTKIPREEFNLTNRIVVHDLFTLLKQGVIFSQLADIFHNLEHVGDRADKGRYIVLVNLLRNFYKKGSGRLTNWMQAVDYPNIRASGLADLGDRISIDDLIGESARIKEYYSETWRMYQNRTCNYMLANVMAEYLYVLFLVAGRRGVALTKDAQIKKHSSTYIYEIWQNLAEQMLDNATLAISIITHLPEKEIKSHLHAVVNSERLAKQMKYWMTNEYIDDLTKNTVRDDIYDNDTEVEVDFKHLRKGTFSYIYGCSIDGKNPDLGPVNGQEPIKEQNKLIYWTIIYIFVTYNNFRLTLEDIHSIVNQKDIGDSEKVRALAFHHLPKKDYHRINAILCNERLLQKTLPQQLKAEFENKAMTHKKEHAALVIQGFWGEYKMHQPNLSNESKAHKIKK